MVEQILHNLENSGWAMLIFVCAYLSNMSFGMYYNIKVLSQAFDKSKILNSIYKVLAVGIGLVLLVVTITALPAFANYIGWEIPAEYTDVFDDIAVLGACLAVSCKYIAEAAGKFKAILNSKKEESVDENN